MSIYLETNKVRDIYLGAQKVKQIYVGNDITYDNVNLNPNMEDNKWIDIFNAFRNGNAPDTWVVGDQKIMTLLDGTSYYIRLCDTLPGRYAYSDGMGASKCVFEFVNCIAIAGTDSSVEMNFNDTNVGGFATCDLRNTIFAEYILPLIPPDIYSAISTVKVKSGVGGGTTTGTSESDNKLFLPAECEIFAPSALSYSIGLDESPLGRFEYYSINWQKANRIKHLGDTDAKKRYWLRSPAKDNNYAFCGVSINGDADMNHANIDGYGGAPIFAI